MKSGKGRFQGGIDSFQVTFVVDEQKYFAQKF